MVTGYLILLGAVVDDVLTAWEVWGPPLAACVAVLTLGADCVRTRIRTAVRILSVRVRVCSCSRPLTCPDTVRTPSVDTRPDASGHIPGGGP